MASASLFLLYDEFDIFARIQTLSKFFVHIRVAPLQWTEPAGKIRPVES